jgi:serine/threonine protein kinase
MLTHPNTVTVFDYGRTTEGVFYYAMELLDGISLEEIVTIDGPQPETVDARADIYALGAVGYWLLTGTDVFGGRTVLEALAHHVHSIPQAPSARRGAPPPDDLEALILDCLAKRPEDRPRSAHVLRARLRACDAAGGWTNDRAKQWWDDHRAGLRTRAGRVHAPDAAIGAPRLTVTRLAD